MAYTLPVSLLQILQILLQIFSDKEYQHIHRYVNTLEMEDLIILIQNILFVNGTQQVQKYIYTYTQETLSHRLPCKNDVNTIYHYCIMGTINVQECISTSRALITTHTHTHTHTYGARFIAPCSTSFGGDNKLWVLIS